MNQNNTVSLSNTDIENLLKILEKLPAIAYTLRYEKPGDIESLTCEWSNKYAQQFIGLTQMSIEKRGFSFFKQTWHPDDLETAQNNLQLVSKEPDKSFFTFIHRMKPIEAKDYVWLYGHCIVQRKSKERIPESWLCVSFEIGTYMNDHHQLSEALKEIGRQQHHGQWQTLTKREKEVLSCISKGLTDKQISISLFISEATAKTHRNKILKKMKMKNSASLAAFAGECGMN
jgi:DNA-binding CsgD family transcriptional regulator